MTIVSVESYNETYIRVFSDRSIEQDLYEFFKFRPKGYQYNPKFKKKLWDGYIKLYDINKKTLYKGLLPYVVKFCEKNDCELTYNASEFSTNSIDYEDIEEYADSLNLHDRGEPIDIYDYQLDAIHHALNSNRALLISPTSSGKSLIIYVMLRYHLMMNRKCIVVVPSTQLVEQLYNNFTDFSEANGFDVSERVQKLYSGFDKTFVKDVMITTWQSIVTQPKSFFEQFDVIVGDEAHQFAAKSLVSILEKLVDTKYRIGTTGTLQDSKVHVLVLEGLFGKKYDVITTKELMDMGRVAHLHISAMVLKYDADVCKDMCKAQYADEIKWITSNTKRNRMIVNLALSTTGTTLILFQNIETHGKILYDMIKQRVGNDRPVYFIHGKIKTTEREQIRMQCEHDKDAIIVASYGTLSTGVSILSIESIIFASPYKSRVKVIQSIGRGLRLRKGKVGCRLYDIIDNACHKKYKNHTFNHGVERLKLYANQQFNVKLIEMNI